MKIKTLERQVRDLQNLIDELQDTHVELKAAIIGGDLGEASMHANDLVSDLESIKSRYDTPPLRPFINDDSQKLRLFVEPLPCAKLLPPQTI